MGTVYHKNPGEECFGVSLANYFLLVGDSVNEARVRKYFYRHPFVSRTTGRVNIGVTPNIVESLTEGDYRGLLFVDPVWMKLMGGFDEWDSDCYLNYVNMDTIRKSIDLGKVVARKRNFRLNEPGIAFLGDFFNMHAVVDLANGSYIDDGNLINRNSASKLFGLLRLLRN